MNTNTAPRTVANPVASEHSQPVDSASKLFPTGPGASSEPAPSKAFAPIWNSALACGKSFGSAIGQAGNVRRPPGWRRFAVRYWCS